MLINSKSTSNTVQSLCIAALSAEKRACILMIPILKALSSFYSVLKDMWINNNNIIPSVWFCCLFEIYLEKSHEDNKKQHELV